MDTGSVSVTKSPCKVCHGKGRQQDTVTLKIDIPGGASEGDYMPLSGQGHVGRQGGPPGDAIVLIQEEKHSFFTRQGDDIVSGLTISYNQAFLGDKIQIRKLKGYVRLTIPEGTQSGQILRARRGGMPHLKGSGRGDQLVKITVRGTALENEGRSSAKIEKTRRQQTETQSKGHLHFNNERIRQETVPSLSRLRRMKPIYFERRVAEMYYKLGYKKEITDKASGDGGIDIILCKMGKKYLVQCKRYSEKNTVKVGVVRELMGVVASENADGGWVVTTSTFTKAAKEFAKKNKTLKLIDSSDLMDDMKKSLA